MWEFLKALANSAQLQAANRKLQNQIAERMRAEEQFRLLQTLSLAMSAAADIDTALTEALGKVCQTTGWAVGEAWLPSVDRTVLQCSRAWWAKMNGLEKFRQVTEVTTFAMGQGLPGQAYASKRPVWAQDVTVEASFARAKTAREIGLKAGVAIPILADEEAVAILTFFLFEPREKDQSFVELVSAVAAQLGSIIQRKRAEEALRESEERFRSVAQSAADAIVVADDGGRIVSWNKGAQNIFGYKQEEVLGKPLALLMPERYREAQRQGLERLRTTGESRLIGKTVEWYGLRKDGSEFPLVLSLASWKTAGAITQYSGIIHDVTKQKRTEEALRKARDELEIRVQERTQELAKANEALQAEIGNHIRTEKALQHSEKRFRALIENSTDGITLLNPEGRVFYTGPSTTRILGYTVEEFIGRNALELVHPDDLKPAQALLADCVRTPGKVAVTQYRVQHKDGSWRWVEGMINNMLAEPSVAAVVVNYRDVTERKRAESQLNASLKEKELLLKEIHHRVKNNLQVISSLLNLQSKHLKDQHAIEMFHESQQRVKSMALIHEELYKTADLGKIEIASYLRNLTTHLFRSYRAHSQAIALHLHVDEIRLDVDRAISCGLIINELVSNSLKHAFPDSALAMQPHRGKEIRIELRSENDERLNLLIRDNGVGLPKDLDFRHTDSLGLQLVNTLTEQLRGVIEHQDGAGTEFRIIFSTAKSNERDNGQTIAGNHGD